MVAHLAVALGDVEINPGVRIDHVDAGELAFELDGLAQVVFGAAVMGEREGGAGGNRQEKIRTTERIVRPVYTRLVLVGREE